MNMASVGGQCCSADPSVVFSGAGGLSAAVTCRGPETAEEEVTSLSVVKNGLS